MWPFLVLLASLGLPALTAVYRPPSCNTSEFACADGACVSLDRLCNGARDCADGSDEQACALTSYKSGLHDLILHRYTRQSECGVTQFRCRDGTCISFDGKCDGVKNCKDGSDETHALCRKMPCQSNLFRCTYGACVDGTAACNGQPECADSSDELSAQCRADVRVSNGKFRCTSGQEIPSTDLCDGVATCADASDESLEACADTRCAYSHLFQCAYGACVDAGADCDNKQDCYDGSDESDELCNRTTITTHTPLNFCILPNYPENGKYTAPGTPSAQPGSVLNSVALNVTCNEGYALKGSQNAECRNGVWSTFVANCVRYCVLKPHDSVTYLCGPEEECGPRVLAGSTVTPECKAPNYYNEQLDMNMRCLDGGSFDKTTICKPECGTISPEGEILVFNGSRAEHGRFPWHATIYRHSTIPYEQICGGSLVSTSVVLTAAHCFDHSSNASFYSVALGKIYRPWNNKRETAHKSAIEDISRPRHYDGANAHFQSDIAVLKLKTPVKVTPFIRPVCLDFREKFSEEQLKPGSLGLVAGFGLTETGKSSQVLLYSELPYVDLEKCRTDLPADFRPYINNDKICAGTLNGTALCQGDSGGGLVFPSSRVGTTRYYLRGIVSTAPKLNNSCNPNTYTTFTHVQPHESFIRKHFSY